MSIHLLAAKSKIYLLAVGMFVLTEIDERRISGAQTSNSDSKTTLLVDLFMAGRPASMSLMTAGYGPGNLVIKDVMLSKIFRVIFLLYRQYIQTKYIPFDFFLKFLL